jgi:hypothetical protein
MKFLRALRAGVSAAIGNDGAKRYRAGGRSLACSACGGQTFARGTAQLQSAGMSFIGLEWTQKEATTLACATCSRVEFFLDAPDEA